LANYIGVNKVTLDWKNYHPSIIVSGKEPPAGDQSLDMTKFWTVFDKVQANFYDRKAVDPQKMPGWGYIRHG